MDEIDREIIKILQEDSRTSITNISKMVNLSRPSVKERIDKMIEKEIIESFTITVDAEKIGRKVNFFIELSDINISNNIFLEKMLTNDAIIEIHAVTGSNNFIMKASTPNIESMKELLEELMNYGDVETSLVLNSPLKKKIILPIKNDGRD